MNVYTILALILMSVLPAALLWLCRHVRFCAAVGSTALCYAAGLLLSLLPVPYDKSLTQTVASVAVALAIPLLLFGFDLLSMRKLAAKTALGMGLQFIAVAFSAAAVFSIAKPLLNIDYAAPLSGMVMGLYTGGTPNLVATGQALLPAEHAAEIILAANTADFIVGGIYFFFLLTFARPVYDKLLGRTSEFDKGKAVDPSEESIAGLPKNNEENRLNFITKDKKRLQKLALCLLLAIACLGVGALLEILINGSMDGSLYIMITVSVLGLLFGFVPRIRAVEGTYSTGQYLILVFAVGLSMSLDLSVLVRNLLPILAFFAIAQILTALLHLLLCKIFHIDGGTALITSTAGIYGPPFIAPVANAYGDRSLIAPGVICGVFGLAVGNLAGIGFGTLLGLL